MNARPHLDQSGPDYWGVLGEDGPWRLILTHRRTYGLQEATPEGWRMFRTWPLAIFALAEVESVFDCGPRLTAVCEVLPYSPRKLTKRERRDLLDRCRAIAAGPRSGPQAGASVAGAVS